jgi:REP element-mobilizing transposase RayT
MAQSLCAVYLHVVFSTKGRQPFLTDSDEREALHQYLGGVSKTLGCHPVIVGGTADHVHLLAAIGRSVRPADWVKELKRVSTLWLKERRKVEHTFRWQAGYGCFSVSPSHLDRVRAYIVSQEEHHRKSSFQDEFRILLRRHDIEWDERYVWD